MTDKSFARFHERGQGRALIELAKQYPPKDALREFVTNSLDARVPGTAERIVISTDPYAHRVIISDDGTGMTYEKLASLPVSIGYSNKAGDVDARGEKALGLLAYGSLGRTMHVISRASGFAPETFGYLLWELDESKERIPYECRILTSKEIDRDFGGRFSRGTRILIDGVPEHVMDHVLTIANLKHWLRALYTPALRKGSAEIYLGRVDKKRREGLKIESLEAMVYERETSSMIQDEVFPILIKGDEIAGNLEVLLYIDPEASCDKVGVYSKDVMVYESLAELPEFSKSPVFTSGKISGYVNDHFNKLILGRAGIDRNRSAFKAWYDSLKEIETKILPIIEEKKKYHRVVRESTYIKQAFSALADCWKELRKNDFDTGLKEDPDGDLTSVDENDPIGRRRRGRKHPPHPHPHPGPNPDPPKKSFTASEDGKKRRVSPVTGVPFGFPQPIDFPVSESHLRSKLEVLLGTPTLYLNSSHADYQVRVGLKESTHFVRYIAELIAKEAVFYDFTEAEKEGRIARRPSELVSEALQMEERMKFLALQRLGIK